MQILYLQNSLVEPLNEASVFPFPLLLVQSQAFRVKNQNNIPVGVLS
jgi:hypothetical protein